MTVGELITEARLTRRKELENQLRALMVGREPETGEQLAEWSRRVEAARAELKIWEQSP